MAICNNYSKYVNDTDTRCLNCGNSLTPTKLKKDDKKAKLVANKL